ncbi:uncharacterized protein LOC102802600 [Saccoglossus kowalevskii]
MAADEESHQGPVTIVRDGFENRSSTPRSFSTPDLITATHRRRPRPKYCMAMERFINSVIVQVIILLMVVLICLIATTETLVAYRRLKFDSSKTAETVITVLHYVCLFFFIVFVFEVIFRICAMGVEYFHQPMQIVDGLVVFLTFTLDVSLWLAPVSHPALHTLSFLIIIRMGRLHLIIKGITDRVREDADVQIELERIMRRNIEACADKLQQQCDQQNKEIAFLKDLLQQHHIESLQSNGSVIHTDSETLKKAESSSSSTAGTIDGSPIDKRKCSVDNIAVTNDHYATATSTAILQSAMDDVINRSQNIENIEKDKDEVKTSQDNQNITIIEETPATPLKECKAVSVSMPQIGTAANPPIRYEDLDTLNLELAEIRRLSQEALLQDFTTPLEGINNEAIPTTSL